MSSLRKRKVAKIENPYVAQQEKKVQTVEKKKRGLMRRLTLYSVFAAVFLIFAVSTLITQNVALDEKVQQKQELKGKLAELKKDETLLKEEIVKLNDDDYIAKIARRDYFLSEKGEIIFTLPKGKEDSD
ncbi:FtsB family cell division protein [Peribacillus castrilensis]|jgi:cell division protein DivIC|uniref:Septum formation initiator family protein n=3 Tax=Peribacillus TaxID=2675229 RepID=A0AAJ1QIF4_9BACI|nr:MULTISPECIES: septum formation initiator family protein [Bacillaceae]KOR81315.1 cell division protein DIVIC [Bacillus sp. FJAT-21352]KOR85000.1 cell division protein DIVIC [Bacillus sp. FJAT-22058]KRF58326.1 cell division protein DIVIC [Bacillus sp. Soil745]MBD8138600.1 septum formation initiator family protein [Bacillus sp. CFBP 13597]MBL3645272.1 septum formation initiator family protein [Bacillus sp. RHFB]MBT2604768.1 septum formation initiator family protein [Bacillus sp. ISL-53]MCP10